MSVFSTRKRWAVWVVIAWVATAISIWAIQLAGSQALQSKHCVVCRPEKDPCHFKDRKALDFEVGTESPFGQSDQSRCIQEWLKAGIEADFLLIPSYSALLAFILFLLAGRDGNDACVHPAWYAIGVVLAAVMVAADTAENVLILSSIEVDRSLRLLWPATATKWGAVALASALAGVLALVGVYKRRRSKQLANGADGTPKRWPWPDVLDWLTGFAGLATGAIIAIGLALAMSRQSTAVLNAGTVEALPIFFTLALIHAVAVVVRLPADPEVPAS